MRDSRFIELIKSLSVIDIADLKSFVDAPLFNNNRNVSILYNIIAEYPPKRQINEIKLYQIFNTVKKISRPNFRMILSSFSNLIEAYIVHREISRDKFTSDQYLLNYAFDNDLEYLLQKTISRLDSYFLNRIDLSPDEKLAKFGFQKIKSLLSKDKKIIGDLYKISDSLFSEIKLELGNLFQSSERELNTKNKNYSLHRVPEPLKETKKKLKSSDLSLYLQLLLSESRSGKLNGKKELEELFKITDSKEIKNLISEFLINSPSLKLNELPVYAAWHWSNASKRSKLLNADKLLFIALQNYDLGLSREIVNFIGLNARSSKGFFSKALYHFYFNDFFKCLEELEKISPKDKGGDAQLRQLTMCCYLRLDQFKKFSNAYFAFKKFAALNKDIEIVNETKKFCDILFRITSNKENPDNLLKIKLSISGKELINKNWLENELEFHFKNLA